MEKHIISGWRNKVNVLTDIKNSGKRRAAIFNVPFYCLVHPFKWNWETGRVDYAQSKLFWTILIGIRVLTGIYTASLSLTLFIRWKAGEFQLNTLSNIYILLASVTFWITEMFHIQNILRPEFSVFVSNSVSDYFSDFERKFKTFNIWIGGN